MTFTNRTPREFCHPSNLTVQTFRDHPQWIGDGAWNLAKDKPAEVLHEYAINICEGCWEALDPDVWTGIVGDYYVMDMLALMKAGDYFALLLASVVVCIQASNEARDGKLLEAQQQEQ